MKILSLGAGVQSTAVLLMSHIGELPKLDAAVFADTGWEPKAVYDHLAWLESISSVPIYRVSQGNIRADALNPESRFASMPLFVKNANGTKGMIRRQCTSDYKIKPIRRKVRELLQASGEKVAEQWFGISLDEVQRMRDSDVRYQRNVYPLIERRMTRQDCLRWMASHEFPTPPKSACIGCPFHGDAQWRALRDVDPAEWDDAVAFDAAIRDGNVRIGKEGMRGQVFLHSSLKPLPLVDLSTPKDHGQDDLFGNECEGMCGV